MKRLDLPPDFIAVPLFLHEIVTIPLQHVSLGGAGLMFLVRFNESAKREFLLLMGNRQLFLH